MVLSSAAFAGELRFVGEVRYEDQSRKFHPVSARYVELAREWEPGDAKTRLSVVHTWLLDLVERKRLRVTIPLTVFRERNRAILDPHSVPTLLHYDGEISTVLFNQSVNFKTIAKWVAQYDHRSGRFSELTKICDDTASHIGGELGFDPTEKYFYFADFIDDAGDIMHHRPTSMHVKRFELKRLRVDWELDVVFPKRARALELTGWLFDGDGKRLALFEYDDRAGQRKGAIVPPAQVYVIDIEARSIETYPAPLSVYARFFSPDGKSLIIGSNELGEISRIDLEAKRIAVTKKGHSMLHAFAVSPSGKTFLSFANTELTSPKAIEVRRTDTLALVASIPVRLMVPGSDHSPTTLVQFNGGRGLALPVYENEVAAKSRAIRFFELPDELDQSTVEGASAREVQLARGVVAARQQADAMRLVTRPDPRVGDPEQTFAEVVVSLEAQAFLVGIQSGNSDGDYKPGRTKPVVIRVDPTGKLVWARTLALKGFLDFEAGGVAATADGGCVVHLLSYVHGGSPPVAQFVKLDAAGRTQWATQFPGGGGPLTRIADVAQLLPDGSVAVTGRVSTAHNAGRWRGALDANGKITLDRAGE